MSDLRKRQVTQGNPLARSAQQMDIHEKRLVLFAISQIRWSQEEFEPLELHIADLKAILNSNNKNIYALASKSARGLLKRTIFIGGDDDDEPWTEFQWVSRCSYIPGSKRPDKQSVIVLEFHQGLKPFLLQLKEHYNSIPLIELLSVPSFNSMRLLEILYHDSYRGARAFLSYEVEDLKKRLGLEGKYQRFKDFRYVLDRAQQDFLEHTSLKFTYEGVGGRTYEQVRFHVEPNPDYVPPPAFREALQAATVDIAELTPDEAQLVEALTKAGYSQHPVEALRLYGCERVKRNLLLAQRKATEAATTKNPIKNLGGLIAYMLKHDVAAGEAAAQAQMGHKEKLESAIDLLEQSFSHQRGRFWREYWASLPRTTQDDLDDILRASLGSGMIRLLEREQWSGLLTEAQRAAMLAREHGEKLPAELRTVAAYAAASGLLSDFDEETQTAIIAAAADRLT